MPSNLSATFVGICLLAQYHEMRSYKDFLTYKLAGVTVILDISHFPDPDKEEGQITKGDLS